MKLLNSKGQALFETIVSLPALIAFYSALLVGGHSLLTDFLVDHWIYESTFCVAAEQPEEICRNELRNKMEIIPFINIQSLNLSKFRNEVQASTLITTPYLKNWNFRQTLSTNLSSKDFEDKF